MTEVTAVVMSAVLLLGTTASIQSNYKKLQTQREMLLTQCFLLQSHLHQDEVVNRQY